jgi:ketosteroid isomerase-like protein
MADPDAKSLAREVLATFLEGDNDLGYMDEALPQLIRYIEAVAAPDFTCLMVGMPPAPAVTYEGADGLARAWSDWGEAFEKVRAELEEVRESDDHIVVLVNQVAITRHHGVEISQPSAMVFAFEDGRVTRAEFHLDRAAALKSAGLDPGSAAR